MKTFACTVLLCLSFVVASAQRIRRLDIGTPGVISPAMESPRRGVAQPFALKRPGHYTQSDWRLLVDSLWGPGLPAATKLSVFDTFWYGVDRAWGGFPNLVINWDSLRTVYRPQVDAGVSRGRFAGILSRLTRELLEWHVGAMDRGIDSTLGLYPDLLNFPVGYPNYGSFRYSPGVPLLNINILFWRTNFGAGLTLLQDGSIMVYNVIPNHPLSLQPGDIILGYDGVPWKQLVKELFDAELPILSSDLVGNWTGSTVDAANHQTMISAGMNWGLFDTIDVVKYSTKDTVHYPTSLLSSIAPPYLIATEQMPVNGVPFPDLDHNKLLSWGIVQGTNIGYIYGWDWSGNPWRETQTLFTQAVDDLMHQHHVDGLILDFRTNPGGWPEFANGGFAQLFNFDPTPNFSRAIRVRGTDHFAFTLQPPLAEWRFSPGPELFDHPIAVLTGPLSGSSGDYNAFRLRFHPMVRFFGKPTCGGYTALTNASPYGTIYGPYFYRIDDASVYSNVNNEGYMIHKAFPVDEEVWLTQEGVVRGEDDVVRAALAWMTTLTYAHSAAVEPPYGRPGLDSVTITAILTNPLMHTAVLSAIVTDAAGTVRDSLPMFHGAHGDVGANSVWACRIRAPLDDNMFFVSIRTTDLTKGTFRRLPNVARLTTAGPVVCVGDTAYSTPRWGDAVTFRLRVSNNGSTIMTPAVGGNIRSLDTAATVFGGSPFSVGDIPPGEVRFSSPITIAFSSAITVTKDVPFELLFSSNGIQYWRDTVTIQVLSPTGIVADHHAIPKTYELYDNYPNPFNPTTKIQFSIVNRQLTIVKVFDVLGREVATLVNEIKEPGTYTVQWDASRQASGVYFYRLSTSSFVQTRRLVLLR